MLNLLTIGALCEGKFDYSFFELQDNTLPQDFALYDIFILTSREKRVLELAMKIRALKSGQCRIVFFHEYFDYFKQYLDAGFDYIIYKNRFQSLLDCLESDKYRHGLLSSQLKYLGTLSEFPYIKYPGQTLYQEPALKDVENPEGPKTALTFYSRGCPHECTFCINPFFYEGTVDFRNPEMLISEFKYFRTIGIDCFSFEDADLLTDFRELQKLAALIEKNGLEIRFRSHARADNISDHVADLLRRMGCRRLDIGLESGSVSMLARIRKNITPEQVLRAVEICHCHGIEPFVLAIAGLPGETMEDLSKTGEFLSHLRQNNVRYGLSFYRPMPGSELFSQTGQLEETDFGRQNPAVISYLPKDLTREALSEFYFLHTGIRPETGAAIPRGKYHLQAGGTLAIEIRDYSSGKFEPIPLNYWSGDQWCRTGWAHLVGRFKGRIEYIFSAAASSRKLCIRFRASTQSGNAGTMKVSLNGTEKEARLPSKSQQGGEISVFFTSPCLDRECRLSFICDDGNGLSLFGESLDKNEKNYWIEVLDLG